MRIALSGNSLQGCRASPAPFAPGAARQHPDHSTRLRLSCNAAKVAPSMSGKSISDLPRSGSRVRTRILSTPLMKTAKTTLFYAKPKPVKAPSTVTQTESNFSSVAATSEVDTCEPTHEPTQATGLNSSVQPVETKQMTEEPTPPDSGGESESVMHQRMNEGCSELPSEPPGAAGSDPDNKLHGSKQVDSPIVPVQVPSSIQRPWDNVPKPAALSGAMIEGGRQHRKALVTQPATVGDNDDVTSAYAYLRSRGLTELQAERLSLELDGEGSRFADAHSLRDQLRKLDRLLPGMNVNVLLCKDTLILTTDTSTAASRLVRLHSLLGSPNLASLLHVAPQLLYAEEVEERVEQCITRLMELLPSGYDIGKLQRLLVEAPTIVFRMDHFGSEEDITSLNDLPADLVHRLTVPESQEDNCMSCLI